MRDYEQTDARDGTAVMAAPFELRLGATHQFGRGQVRAGSRIPVSAHEATMAEAGSLEVRRFHDQEGHAFRAIGWALLLSLPAWAGVMFLIFG